MKNLKTQDDKNLFCFKEKTEDGIVVSYMLENDDGTYTSRREYYSDVDVGGREYARADASAIKDKALLMGNNI